MFGKLDRTWDFPHKIISHLSFCSAWLTMELWQIILTRYHWEVCLERGSAKQTRLSCEKGRINMACTWIWEVFYLAFGEIFQMLLRRTEESTPQNWFCSNEWEILQWHRCSSCCVSVWKQHFRIFFLLYVCVHVCAPVNVCVTEPCRQRISRNLSSAVLMLAGRQTWGLTEEPIIIILEKWSKVSFYSPRRGCLSLWEDVWLPPLYVFFGPLSWFSYTSTFSSKHVRIFHAH